MTDLRTVRSLAPTPAHLDGAWSETTLASIIASPPEADARPVRPARRHGRRLLAGLVGAAVVTGGAAAGVAALDGVPDVVPSTIRDFIDRPDVESGLGQLDDPRLVASFPTAHAVMAVWVGTTSTGKVCYAMTDPLGTYDGDGPPTREQLEYGCGGMIVARDGHTITEMRTVRDLGGFMRDGSDPMVYGVGPAGAVRVHVVGRNVDVTLPLRAESHGFGTTLPGSRHTPYLDLTFIAEDGTVVDRERWVAPIG